MWYDIVITLFAKVRLHVGFHEKKLELCVKAVKQLLSQGPVSVRHYSYSYYSLLSIGHLTNGVEGVKQNYANAPLPPVEASLDHIEHRVIQSSSLHMLNV